MRSAFKPRVLAAALAAGLGTHHAHALYLDPEGRGQALIYPYFTTQSASGDSFNTYVSVVNHQERAKAVRVRFREGRNGREVFDFNLYLAPNDVWTAAIIPAALSGEAAGRIVTADNSCTDPRVGENRPLELGDFSNRAYTGTRADGLGVGLDRTREGYFEIIEMANLTGAAAAAVAHNSVGMPANCAAVRGAAAVRAADIQPPSGGLSGTLAFINVNNGMDFTLNAEAIAGLTDTAFFRPPGDPYPDFDAAEVVPISDITADGKHYRLGWASGVDAVSSVLMREQVLNEFVLDPGTRSATDWVLTFPMRRFREAACQGAGLDLYNREGRNASATASLCAAANVVGFVASASAGTVLGSTAAQVITPSQPAFQAGWVQLAFTQPDARLRSLLLSNSRDLATDAQTGGSFEIRGVPVVGFMARTFRNGTLACTTFSGAPDGACQGNFGGDFPHRYRRGIAPAP